MRTCSAGSVPTTSTAHADCHRDHHIAGDILRRFSPGYTTSYHKAHILYLQHLAPEQRRDSYVQQIAGITAGHIDDSGTAYVDDPTPGKPSGTFQVQHDGCIDVELRNLDLETACELATLLFPR